MLTTLAPCTETQPDAQASPKLRVLIVGHTYVVGVNQGKLEAIANAGAEVGLLVHADRRAQKPDVDNQQQRVLLDPPDTDRLMARAALFSVDVASGK